MGAYLCSAILAAPSAYWSGVWTASTGQATAWSSLLAASPYCTGPAGKDGVRGAVPSPVCEDRTGTMAGDSLYVKLGAVSPLMEDRGPEIKTPKPWLWGHTLSSLGHHS